MNTPRLGTAVVTLLLLGLVGWVGYRLANATAVHTYHIQFAALPESEKALAEWLAEQPGVTNSSVTRNGQTVVVEFVRSLYDGLPPFDPVGQAKQYGYGDLRGYTTTMTSRW